MNPASVNCAGERNSQAQNAVGGRPKRARWASIAAKPSFSGSGLAKRARSMRKPGSATTPPEYWNGPGMKRYPPGAKDWTAGIGEASLWGWDRDSIAPPRVFVIPKTGMGISRRPCGAADVRRDAAAPRALAARRRLRHGNRGGRDRRRGAD